MRPFTTSCDSRTCTSRCQGEGGWGAGKPGGFRSWGSRAGHGGAGARKAGADGQQGGQRVRGQNGARAGAGPRVWGGRVSGPGCLCQPHACSSRSAPGPATLQAPGRRARSTQSFGEARSPGARAVWYQESPGWEAQAGTGTCVGCLDTTSVRTPGKQVYHPHLANEESKAQMCRP